MIERRVRDFRLDSRLRRYCQEDILGLCMGDATDGDETDVQICLQVGQGPGPRAGLGPARPCRRLAECGEGR
jgi:hypothetical protein